MTRVGYSRPSFLNLVTFFHLLLFINEVIIFLLIVNVDKFLLYPKENSISSETVTLIIFLTVTKRLYNFDYYYLISVQSDY